jgi:hypothetical protein
MIMVQQSGNRTFGKLGMVQTGKVNNLVCLFGDEVTHHALFGFFSETMAPLC